MTLRFFATEIFPKIDVLKAKYQHTCYNNNTRLVAMTRRGFHSQIWVFTIMHA